MITDQPPIKPAYLETPHGRVHYLEAGSGDQSIILFHETPLSSRSFLASIPLLAQHIRVIAFDTPGYGGSEPLAGPPTIEGYADVLWSAIQQLELSEVALCGIHTGTSIAIELACREPQCPKIVGIVLSGVPHLNAEGRAFLTTFLEREKSGKAPTPEQVEEAILQTWRDRVHRWVRPPTSLLVQCLADELSVFPRRNEGFKAVRDHDIGTAISRVKLPVLVLNGEHDSMARMDAENVRLFANAKLELLPDRGGQLQGSAPELYTNHLLQFLLPKFTFQVGFNP